MADDPKKSKGGSKLSRSEITTVRLDPKLRYLAELAARKQRRTLSSYIEWAVENSLRDVKLYEGTGYNGDNPITVDDEAAALWDVDEAERFIRLAITYPSLLTHEEQERWKMLSDSGLLAPARQRNRAGVVSWDHAKLDDEVYPVIRRRWPDLVEAHQAGLAAQRKWVASTLAEVSIGAVYFGYPPRNGSDPGGFDDLLNDEKIPF